MFGDTNQRSRHERMLVVVAAACWQQRTFCAGAHAVEYTFAREPPGAFSVFARTHESQTPRVVPLARTAAVVRIRVVALLPRHTSSAAESGATCRWRGASAKARC